MEDAFKVPVACSAEQMTDEDGHSENQDRLASTQITDQRPASPELLPEDSFRQAVDTSCLPRETVMLNIYDARELANASSPSTSSDPLLAGACHAGVEVFGTEWCFHKVDETSPAVLRVAPRNYPGHSYRTCVPKGCTRLSEKQIMEVMNRLEEEWAGGKFNPVLHNSLRFCSVLCDELGVGRIATWEEQAANDVRSPTSLLSPVSQEQATRVAGEALDALRRRSLAAVAMARSGTEQITAQASAFGEVASDRTEVLETVRQSSLETIEYAQCETAKIMGIAQARGQILADAASVQASALRSLSGNLGESFSERSHVVSEKTHEQARLAGSNLWSWAADAQKAAARAFGDQHKGSKNRRGKMLRSGLVNMLPKHEVAGSDSLPASARGYPPEKISSSSVSTPVALSERDWYPAAAKSAPAETNAQDREVSQFEAE